VTHETAPAHDFDAAIIGAGVLGGVEISGHLLGSGGRI
jgi:hypothetical protein